MKPRVCGCGHEESWHLANARDPKAPRLECNYGHNTTFGRCACTRFHRKRRGEARAPEYAGISTPPETPISPIADAFARLDRRMREALDEFRNVLRSSSFEVTKGRAPAREPLIVQPPTLLSQIDRLSGERKVLTAIAQFADRGGVTRDQLGVLTGYKRSTRNTYLQRLDASGAIYEQAGRVFPTPKGFDDLGPNRIPLPTGIALQDYWRTRLRGGELVILEALIAAHPAPISPEGLSGRTGYTRSSRNTFLQRLRARLIVEPVSGGYALHALLVEKGAGAA